MNTIEQWFDNVKDAEVTQSIIDWLQVSGLRIAFIIILVIIARHFLGMVIRRLVNSSVKPDHSSNKKAEQQREDTIVSIITNTLRVVLWLVATIVILEEFGVNIGAMVAGAGALGLAFGFGAQSLISDFVAGVFIIMENQYRVGDIIEINGKSGVVKSITIRTTILRDLDGYEHHVPNGSITTATNMSKDFSNMHFNMGVSYETDIDQAEKVINEVGAVMAKTKKWGEKIIEPPKFVRVDEFSDSSIDLKILARVQPGTQWTVAGEFRRRLKVAFEKHKIEIPYPHVVIKR